MEQAKEAAGAAGETASENDDILYRARPHLLALLWPLALFAAAAALAIVAERHVPGFGPRVGFRGDQAASFETACRVILLAAAAVFGLNLFASIVECLTTAYVVTPARVTASTRLVRVTSATVYLAKVEAVIRDQGPIERLCDVGSVTLVGTGGARETLTNVRDFSRFMTALERAIPARHDAR